MAAKQLEFNTEARARLKRGVDQLAEAVNAERDNRLARDDTQEPIRVEALDGPELKERSLVADPIDGLRE